MKYFHFQQHGKTQRILLLVKQVRQRKTNIQYHLKVESKYNSNESIYKTGTDSQTQKTNLWLPKKKGRGKEGKIRSMWLKETHYYI